MRALAPLLLALAAAPVAAARTETPLATPPGPFADVTRSLVTIDAPANLPGAPEACRRHLQYYRYRRADGPADPQAADAVLVGMPGILGGAASLEMNALQVVQNAADRDRSVEYWALDRRANCLEDRRGLDAAARAGDARTAIDYYHRGAEVDGRRFSGWPRGRQVQWLQRVGLRQVVEDQRAVILDRLPDPEVRAKKVFCGGHSLGGLITGLLLSWDFDGDPATARDTGAGLCGAGSVALDTLVSADPIGVRALPDIDKPLRLPMWLGHRTVSWAIRHGHLPADIDVGFINPQVVNLLGGVALNARLAPEADAHDLIAAVPPTPSVQSALRFFHSETSMDASARVPLLRRQRLSGEALFGALVDDNAQPLAFVEASVGMYDAGPVMQKRYPFGPGAQRDPVLKTQVGSRPLVIPGGDRLIGWRRYDEALPDLRLAEGTPVTDADSEVTDLEDLARVFSSGPLDFAEAYFPTQLVVDVLFALGGARSGDLSHVVRPEATAAMPRLTLFGGDSFTMSLLDAGLRDVPEDIRVLSGYNHLDVVTASPRQVGGRPEQASRAVSDFLLAHLPPG